MRAILFQAVPFMKEEVTLALESGVSGLIVPQDACGTASSLARILVVPAEEAVRVTLKAKKDEDEAAAALSRGSLVVLAHGWEIIPVENLLAREEASTKPIKGAGRSSRLALEVTTPEEAKLAIGILERGVETLVVPPAAVGSLKAIVSAVQNASGSIPLVEAVITEITSVGMGHRVCVDTLSILATGEGMLVGNSAAFTFLVNGETEHNEYVAARPFRVNAGAVHAYAVMDGDTTAYLEEVKSGRDILLVNHRGETRTAVVGRVKVEQRPMLLIRAKTESAEGAVFLQNAETIRLVTPEGKPKSVVALREGDAVLCRLDVAGRHFGIRINENITEA